MSMGKILIVANWKMNPQNLTEARKIFNSVKIGVKKNKNAEVVICPPSVFLPVLSSFNKNAKEMVLGGQNCHWMAEGAYTGEISPAMLKNLDCRYVIIGHSERRKHLKETDVIISKKIKSALTEKLKPILCIANLSQLKKGLKGVSGNVIVAFEPISAIGTGRPYSVEKAKKMRALINGKKIPVLYGGSVNSQNAGDYIKKAGFQGLLIGGSSLKPKEFLKIIENINKLKI